MKKGSAFEWGSSLDFLSHPVGFNVRGQQSVKTKVGVFFSIICMGLFVTLSWVTIANYLDTSRPVISYETQSMKVKEPANIKQSRLYPIIFFTDQINLLTPGEMAKYISPYIIFYKETKAGDVYQFRMKLVPCKDLIARGKTDTITAESEGTVKTNYKEYGYCIDDEGKEFELGADDSRDVFSVAFYPCTLTDGSCKSPAELGRLATSISFPQVVTNFGDYNSPITYVTETSEYVGLNTYFWTVNYHSLRINEVMQERGFLSKIETTHRYVSVDKSTSQIRNRDSSQTTCLENKIDYCTPYIVHNFLMTNKKMKIVRSYKGFVESISEIGGMIDLIFIIFVLMYSFYHRFAYQSFFIEEIYGIKKTSSNLCKKKIKAEVHSLDSIENNNVEKLFKKAQDQVTKDLDIITLIEEMNLIKLFLMDTFGLKFSGDQLRYEVLKELDEFRCKNQKEILLNVSGTEQLARQFSSTPNNNQQPRSGSMGHENSGLTKPQTQVFSPANSVKSQVKYRKSLLSNVGKRPQDQISKFAQLKHEADSKFQLSELKIEPDN